MNVSRPKWANSDTDELCAAITNLDNMAETQAFLEDLCTKKEIYEMANRWKIARMLYVKFRWSRIEKLTGASSATIAKIQNKIKKGNKGFKMMFQKMTE